MNIDEQALRAVWQRQQPPQRLAQELAKRVELHRRRARIHRAAEVAITLAGVALLAWPGHDGKLSPSQWLLIPFFVVFIAVGWTIVLSNKQRVIAAGLEPVAMYAHVRKVQLRDTARNLKVANAASVALLGYSAAALLLSIATGESAWRDAAAGVVAWAAVWTVGTFLLARARIKAIRREYRQIGRLA